MILFHTEKQAQGVAPKFTQPLKSVDVEEGMSATLECEVIGSPVPSITWFKDGERVEDTARYQTRSNGKRATLTVTNATLDDEGDYKCVAENPLGSAFCSCELLVNEANAKPEFREKMKPFNAVEGETTTFSVQVTGNPQPLIDWYRGKEHLEEDERIEMLRNGERGVYSMTIKDTVPEDAGVYKCIARNDEGEASCKAALAVKELITEPTFEGQEGAKDEACTPVKVGEGDIISLSTVVKGKPCPSVDWFKDDQKLLETSRLKMDAKDGEISLLILEAKPNDSGLYKCKARNKAGKAQKTFDVNVQGIFCHEPI